MEIKSTPISGLFEITPKVYPDQRGWFYELYKEAAFSEIADSVKFLQENLSFSKKGVLRGLHLQLDPFRQAKLVTVITGKVLDVVVDLRPGSKTFGQVHKCLLDGSSHKSLFVPEGFAHGFSTLEDTHFYYKCSSLYNPKYETGIRWDDPQLKIDWQVSDPILSDKDKLLPTLEELLIKSVISPR
ncbi:MAG TPA: dTDP-4-dehydrorhamnose 3,5-epimerase [Cytophagales bacterium]|nr:dTDP-4-dehydrorhamnose 3,5-epimerase [Cytophagales bacterium]